MTSWHEGPMAGFDLETTSADPETAHIVTACVAVVYGDRSRKPEVRTWLSDVGGEEIPKEASDIHGITTEMARADGMAADVVVADITQTLFTFASRMPIVIFNAPYDLTVLDREMRRHSIGCQPAQTTYVIDPYVLDKHLDTYRKGKRTLTACCEHYGVRLDGAHDATADTLAALRLAWKLAQTYPRIAAMDPAELHELQVKAKAEQAASFQEYLAKQGKTEVIDGSWPVKPWAVVT